MRLKLVNASLKGLGLQGLGNFPKGLEVRVQGLGFEIEGLGYRC